MKYLLHLTWLPISLLILSVGLTTPATQAEEGNSQTSSAVEVLNNPLVDAKIKRLGEPLQVQYTFKTHKKSESYDVYIAHSAVNSTNDGLVFIQPSGEFINAPLPYYTKISSDTEEIVLDFTLLPSPTDNLNLVGEGSTDNLTLVGEHFFYAALLKTGTDVSGLAPTDWPWEKVSTDSVFVSR